MLQVKIFDEEHEKDLEETVNEFLQSVEDEQKIKDIQYQVSVAPNEEGDQIYCFSAMVIYRA
jgi:hypothetical protein